MALQFSDDVVKTQPNVWVKFYEILWNFMEFHHQTTMHLDITYGVRELGFHPTFLHIPKDKIN